MLTIDLTFPKTIIQRSVMFDFDDLTGEIDKQQHSLAHLTIASLLLCSRYRRSRRFIPRLQLPDRHRDGLFHHRALP